MYFSLFLFPLVLLYPVKQRNRYESKQSVQSSKTFNCCFVCCVSSFFFLVLVSFSRNAIARDWCDCDLLNLYIYIFFCLEKGIRCVIKLSFVWICHWYFRSSSFSKRPLRLCSELTLRRVVKFAWLAVQVAVGEDKAEREPACYGRITISRYARGRYAIRVLPRHKKNHHDESLTI